MRRKGIAFLMTMLTLSCTVVTPAFASNADLVTNEVEDVIVNQDNESVEDGNVVIEPRVAQYVWTNTALNVRKGPGTKYAIVKTLPKNTKLWITYA